MCLLRNTEVGQTEGQCNPVSARGDQPHPSHLPGAVGIQSRLSHRLCHKDLPSKRKMKHTRGKHQWRGNSREAVSDWDTGEKRPVNEGRRKERVLLGEPGDDRKANLGPWPRQTVEICPRSVESRVSAGGQRAARLGSGQEWGGRGEGDVSTLSCVRRSWGPRRETKATLALPEGWSCRPRTLTGRSSGV